MYFVCMLSDQNHVVVVGGGGAGIIAAWHAAARGCPVLLLERNGRLGTKILISGGGKCNVTHVGTVDDLLAAFVLSERRFLKGALHRFSNRDVQDLLASQGITLAPRANGRIFPVNGTAKDVVRVLSRLLQQHNVITQFHQRVEEILVDGSGVIGVDIGGRSVPTRQVILATGGASYPQTGTTGDGFAMARHVGHTIVPVRPALAPIQVKPSLPHAWRGVAIRDGCLSVHQGGRRMTQWRGDLLFTHEGISGPAALEVSRAAALAVETGQVHLVLDFLPETETAIVDRELQSIITTHGGRMVSTLLEPWLPNRIINGLLHSAGVDPAIRGHALTREERTAVVKILKRWTIGQVASISLERGEVTAGGVALSEVEPQTMRSRRVKGLYLCGEVLDIAGPVGGYNLQAAFSTGFVAGHSAADDVLRTFADPAAS